MQNFKYKGYDIGGQRIDGEISANTIEEAERRIAAQAVTIVSIIPAGMAKKGHAGEAHHERPKAPLFGAKKVADADVAAILRDLSVMAETGVPFIEALDAVILSSRNPRVKESIKNLKAEIIAGKSLSTGMRSAGLFPSIVSDMVRVAEEGGRLDRALASGAVYLERSADLKKKVMNAMLYPIVLTVIAFITLTVLVVFVLPRFAGIFTKMGADIPITTQVLLSFGALLREYPLYTGLGLVGLAVAVKMAFSSPVTSKALATAGLKVPVLGELLRKLALSRALQSIATLLGSNVSLMAALEHGAKVSGNPVIENALLYARSSVEHGGSFSDSLAETSAFPPMLIQMVSVGERTGRLAALMANTASHMEEEVDARLKALISIVEPVMIVVMGAIVGMITLSIVLPIYSVIQNIK